VVVRTKQQLTLPELHVLLTSMALARGLMPAKGPAKGGPESDGSEPPGGQAKLAAERLLRGLLLATAPPPRLMQPVSSMSGGKVSSGKSCGRRWSARMHAGQGRRWREPRCAPVTQTEAHPRLFCNSRAAPCRTYMPLMSVIVLTCAPSAVQRHPAIRPATGINRLSCSPHAGLRTAPQHH
jgi:hypothetical protein